MTLPAHDVCNLREASEEFAIRVISVLKPNRILLRAIQNAMGDMNAKIRSQRTEIELAYRREHTLRVELRRLRGRS